ncbi:MAG: prolyl oligopeptidase family serine peptidase [Verrucomicrobiales bacterium]
MPQTAHAFHHQPKRSSKPPLQYLLYLPPGYADEKIKSWPLMLFLHGAGERGSLLTKVTAHGPPRLIKKGTDFPFMVVSPQCRSNETWNQEELLALLDDLPKKLRVDSQRIYLTGISMGGYGSWELALCHPERFAAVAPICGGASILPCLLPASGKLAALRRLPIWAFHGAVDDIVPLSESETVVEALKKVGNSPRFTVYPDLNHDCWTVTYQKQELYEWFLSHKLKTRTKSKS